MTDPKTCEFYIESIDGTPLCNNPRNPSTECYGTDCGYYVLEEIWPPKLGESLLEAYKIVTGERLDTYGAPENCFQLIADYWNVYLAELQDDTLTAKDIAHMMMLFKIARIAGPKSCRDNYLDIQGYAAIAGDSLL